MPHQRSLRKGRVSAPGQIYLCTTVTLLRRKLFIDWRFGRSVVTSLMWHDLYGYTTTLAYVVMPDHCHWLFVLGEKRRLADVMAAMKKHSAKLINQALGTSGPIWQPGFHDHALRSDEQIEHVAWYVIHNPVRAGIIDDIWHYPLWDAMWLPNSAG